MLPCFGQVGVEVQFHFMAYVTAEGQGGCEYSRVWAGMGVPACPVGQASTDSTLAGTGKNAYLLLPTWPLLTLWWPGDGVWGVQYCWAVVKALSILSASSETILVGQHRDTSLPLDGCGNPGYPLSLLTLQGKMILITSQPG